jgi:hypothetical protein
VTVAAGSTSQTFSLPTQVVSTATVTTITASYNSSSATSPQFTVNPAPIQSTPALQLISVTPCRVMDTRNPTGPLGGPYLAANTARSIPVLSSTCNIPSTAAAYSLNITVVPRKGSLGSVTLWPVGQSQPATSALTSPDGLVIANAAIVPAGTNGAINALASNDTELIVDINGYFTSPVSNSLQFYPVTPCRVIDTRGAAGTFGGPFLAAGTTRTFPLRSSSCGIPATATTYSLNITVVPRGALGYLSTWPTGNSLPLVSTLNSMDGTVIANAAIVPGGSNGSVNFYTPNDTDLVVDVNGYFAPPGTGGLNFYVATACRVVDTRNAAGTFGGPAISAQQSRSFPLPQSTCGLPASAGAYSLSIMAVPPGFLGYLTAWPTGMTQPLVSTLNALKGLSVANAALVRGGTNGAISVYVSNASDVVIDAIGYFAQ